MREDPKTKVYRYLRLFLLLTTPMAPFMIFYPSSIFLSNFDEKLKISNVGRRKKFRMVEIGTQMRRNNTLPNKPYFLVIISLKLVYVNISETFGILA